ncbi:polysaccharide biosynthesis tyrosine autokinase [Hymenobacter sp. BT188]|uniref:GumC family protein n=1 Tax=Hymenobacter sp. BT188 TaxID=2763504 RepID=UPI001651AA62|nr:tyrosine-protein kinase [Hymenobacter sp. BT188]MBC6609127.1 polysaccharide biosynthesis tyrosine autokinase [Hymenobacter sp. BT188]
MNDALFPLKSDQPDVKDIKQLLRQYSRHWYWFLLALTLSLGVAFLYLRYYAIPQYHVYSTLLVKDDKSGQSLSSADALTDLGSFKTTRNIDNEMQVLKSRTLMERVVSELGLSTTYMVEGRVVDREIYGRGLPIKVLINNLDSTAAGKSFTLHLKPGTSFTLADHNGQSTNHSFGQQIRQPYGTFTIVATPGQRLSAGKITVHLRDVQQLINHYNQVVSVQPVNKEASVLLVSLVDPIPEKAKNIINKLMEVYNKEAIEDKNLMATNTLKFLDERLQYITTELSTVEKGVEQYKSKYGLTDITTQASEYTTLASDYNRQLSEWAIQIDVLESIEDYLRKTTGQYSLVPSTLGIQDATLLGLIAQFNELQLERERMLRTTQPSNPLVQNINEQLANLRVNILENLRNIKRGLQITSNNLKNTSGQFQSQIKRVPAMERALLEINRQQAIKQNIYVYLLQKREETALSLAATASVARVLDPAMGGDYPISPNGQTIYLIALLVGLGLPLAGIYISTLLNNKVQTQQDITNVTATPILGEIVHNNDRNKTVVVSQDSRSPIAEMFRLIRSNLHFEALGKTHLMVLVTSSMGGEGKTFFSINLGASLAITGKRVILLDLDLRVPKVAAELDLPVGLGITDYLINDNILITDIIKPSHKVPNLDVISAGPVPPNPMELMMSPKFAHLLQELKESFDYVIIDTPPIGQVADAFALRSFADFSIYLVRYNYTYKAQLKIVQNILKNKTLNNPLIVLNDAKEANGTNYGYGYGYGYGQKALKRKKTVG